MKTAFITGITGQDGSYLAELLLRDGYEVHGLVRRSAAEDEQARFSRINDIFDDITVHYGDVSDYPTLWNIIARTKPDEVYHLAAQSQVGVSFKDPFGTFRTNADSTHYLLSALRELAPGARFYFAGTSEMFGDVLETPQSENTPFNPVSPYGISKVTGHHLTKMYREAYGVFACGGILFNHESPRRGFEFVTRKITSAVARIKLGKQSELCLGNLDAKRDWGFAGDYVEAMHKMLRADEPRDYVIGTGESRSVREFLEIAFEAAGLKWEDYVKVDEQFLRPAEVHKLCADPSRAREELGWEPKTSFEELVRMMVEHDLEYFS